MANRAVAVVLSFGVVGAGAGVANLASITSARAAAPSEFNCFTSWEGAKAGYDWINGKSDNFYLQDFDLSTSFLDWANWPEGDKRRVQVNVQNNTSSDNIYVLSQLKLVYVLADMAAAAGSMASGVPQGWGNITGVAEEGVIRGGIKGLQDWQTKWTKEVADLLARKWTPQEIADGTRDREMLKTLQSRLLTLNGSAATLVNGFADIWGRKNGTTIQKALESTTAFGKDLVEAIKKEGIKVAKDQKANISSTDYVESILTWAARMGISIARGLSGDIVSIINMILGTINIFGVSGWASRVGAAPIDMLVMRDDLRGVRMAVNDNVSWIATDDRITPATNAGSSTNGYGDLRPREGVGYYRWRDLTKATDLVDDQTVTHMACNSLELAGFDGYYSNTAIDGVRQGLIDAGFKDATWLDAAKLAVGINFRKLLWLENSKYLKDNPEMARTHALTAAARKAVTDAVAVADADWQRNSDVKLEDAAKKGLAKGTATSGFSGVYNQSLSDQYDAAISAAAIGVSFWHAHILLSEMEKYFDFNAEGGVWKAAQPKPGEAPSMYVRVAAFILASTTGSDGTPTDVSAAQDKIKNLAVLYGGNATAKPPVKPLPSKLVTYFKQSVPSPKGEIVYLQDIVHSADPVLMAKQMMYWYGVSSEDVGHRIKALAVFFGVSDRDVAESLLFNSDFRQKLATMNSAGWDQGMKKFSEESGDTAWYKGLGARRSSLGLPTMGLSEAQIQVVKAKIFSRLIGYKTSWFQPEGPIRITADRISMTPEFRRALYITSKQQGKSVEADYLESDHYGDISDDELKRAVDKIFNSVEASQPNGLSKEAFWTRLTFDARSVEQYIGMTMLKKSLEGYDDQVAEIYDATLGATYYGVDGNSIRRYLTRLAADFGLSKIWDLASKADGIFPSKYVRLVVVLHEYSARDEEQTNLLIDLLAIRFRAAGTTHGDINKLLEWFDSGTDIPWPASKAKEDEHARSKRATSGLDMSYLLGAYNPLQNNGFDRLEAAQVLENVSSYVRTKSGADDATADRTAVSLADELNFRTLFEAFYKAEPDSVDRIEKAVMKTLDRIGAEAAKDGTGDKLWTDAPLMEEYAGLAGLLDKAYTALKGDGLAQDATTTVDELAKYLEGKASAGTKTVGGKSSADSSSSSEVDKLAIRRTAASLAAKPDFIKLYKAVYNNKPAGASRVSDAATTTMDRIGIVAAKEGVGVKLWRDAPLMGEYAGHAFSDALLEGAASVLKATELGDTATVVGKVTEYLQGKTGVKKPDTALKDTAASLVTSDNFLKLYWMSYRTAGVKDGFAAAVAKTMDLIATAAPQPDDKVKGTSASFWLDYTRLNTYAGKSLAAESLGAEHAKYSDGYDAILSLSNQTVNSHRINFRDAEIYLTQIGMDFKQPDIWKLAKPTAPGSPSIYVKAVAKIERLKSIDQQTGQLIARLAASTGFYNTATGLGDSAKLVEWTQGAKGFPASMPSYDSATTKLVNGKSALYFLESKFVLGGSLSPWSALS
ncbi:hypothetical protein [Streptomyces sp. NPDC005533]|uniref:hypothetical protein n=1 Tax=Streptomyces sp. NPDC005533 TaxID=3364723 RepID=UPI0036B26BB4